MKSTSALSLASLERSWIFSEYILAKKLESHSCMSSITSVTIMKVAERPSCRKERNEVT